MALEMICRRGDKGKNKMSLKSRIEKIENTGGFVGDHQYEIVIGLAKTIYYRDGELISEMQFSRDVKNKTMSFDVEIIDAKEKENVS